MKKNINIIQVNFIPQPKKASKENLDLIARYNSGEIKEKLFLIVFESFRNRDLEDIIYNGYYDFVSLNTDLVNTCEELDVQILPDIDDVEVIA